MAAQHYKDCFKAFLRDCSQFSEHTVLGVVPAVLIVSENLHTLLRPLIFVLLLFVVQTDSVLSIVEQASRYCQFLQAPKVTQVTD